MPVDVIPFGNNQSSIDIPGSEGAQQTGSVMRDVYFDMSGNIVKRPVLDQYADTGESEAIKGLYAWDRSTGTGDFLIASASTKIFISTGNYGTTLNEITNGTWTQFDGNVYSRAIFTKHGSDLYVVNGGKIKRIYYNSGYYIDDLTDVDAPTSVISIAGFDKYLIAGDYGTGNFYWSEVNAPTDWRGYYAEAESKPDFLWHVEAVGSLLYLIGAKTVEAWYNDGVTPFVRISQGAIQDGAMAPRSIVFCDSINAFVFRNQKNQLVKTVGNETVSLSPSLDQFLSYYYSATTTPNEVGYYFVYDGLPFYMLSHHEGSYAYGGPGTGSTSTPKSGFSVAVNLLTNDWYEWGAKHTDNRRIPFQIASIITTPVGVLCGDANDGLIHRLTRGGTDDSAYGDSDPMVRSIHVTRGAPGREKICNSLTFHFKAPQTHTSSNFGITVKYSDDGGSTWTSGRQVVADISTGQKAKIVTERNWGRYYQRQWQIDFDDTDDIALGPVIEEFDIV